MTVWRNCLLLLTLCHPVAAGSPDAVGAIVAGRRYAVPRVLSPDADGIGPQREGYSQSFSVQFSWPGMAPIPPGHSTSYASGLTVALVQDISPGTRVEQLAAVPGQRAKFLTLWRDSTVDQFALAVGFDLASLSPADTDEASRLGLRSLGPLDASDEAQGRRLFADGPPASLSVLMMCQAGLSCQLWWMQDEAAVEVTFDERFLSEWASMRRSVAALLADMRER